MEKFGFYHFEMGAFLRELAKHNKTVDEIINVQGKLVPDEIFSGAMKTLLGERIQEKKDLLLDGFPRSFGQYKTLTEWFEEIDEKIDKVVFIDISENETIRRLSGRRTCQVCGKIWNLVTSPIPPSPEKCECGGELTQRKDDKPEQIKLRLSEYRKNTEPLLAKFKEQNLLVEIDGERSIEEIQNDLIKVVESIKK